MLSFSQLRVLEAAMNRIVPEDDFPGAWSAGAGDYLLRQFERDLRPAVEIYRAGLDALDAEAIAMDGQSFGQLAADRQDAVLSRVEVGAVEADWPTNPAAFFQMLVRHTMEGYYADPGNGGNREQVSWKMIGFDVTS